MQQYKIIYTEKYTKLTLKFFKQHPELISRYEKTIRLLEANPFHPSLRLHELKGPLKGIYSVSINMGYRITLKFFISEKEIIPLHIGSHNEVY